MHMGRAGALTDGVAAQTGVEAVVLVISEDRRVRQALVSYLSAGGLSPDTVTGTRYADVDQVSSEIVAVVSDLDGCDLAVAVAAVEVLSRTGAHVVTLGGSLSARRRALAAGAVGGADKWTGIDQVAALVRSAVREGREGQ